MHKLHPGAKWLFRIRGFFGAIIFLMFFGWILFPILGVITGLAFDNNPGTIIAIILFGFFLYLVLVMALAEIYARMSYNRWFYEFTQGSLKLERGIIWKRYSNVPYERIQNVDISRGIIARLCGFSSVHIQTAGYSYAPRGRAGSEGYIPAVKPEEAEHIRDFLMKKISKRQGQGL